MLNKKEGNITGVSSCNSSESLVSSQAGRQAGRCSPSPQGRKQFSGISGLSGRQAGRHSPSFWERKQFISFLAVSLAASQATQAGRCSPPIWGRKQFISIPGTQFSCISGHPDRQAGSCLPSPWGRKQLSGSSGRQVGNNSGSFPFPLTVPPLRQEAWSTLTPLLGPVLPPRQAARSPLTPLQGKALPRQVTTSLQVRQAVKLQLGQVGKLPATQSGIGSSRPPRGTSLPPRQTELVPQKATLHLPP